MLKGLVSLGLIGLSSWVFLGMSGTDWLHMTEPFNNLKSLRTPIVASTSSGFWFLILAVVGWRASFAHPAAAWAKTH